MEAIVSTDVIVSEDKTKEGEDFFVLGGLTSITL